MKEVDILYDTREQLPLWTRYTRRKLEVGDYTTKLLLNKFHVERKSPMDLYGSIIHSHKRFREMLIRGDALEIKIAIYVECTKKCFTTMTFPGAGRLDMKPETLEKIINTIERRYKVEIVWCNSREVMKRKIYERLKLEQNLYKLMTR